MGFSKKSDLSLSECPETEAFGSHCSAKCQLILDSFIPNFKLKYENLGNIKADCVNTVVFNLHQIKRREVFWDTRHMYAKDRNVNSDTNF